VISLALPAFARYRRQPDDLPDKLPQAAAPADVSGPASNAVADAVDLLAGAAGT
jgi:hypothetical protein